MKVMGIVGWSGSGKTSLVVEVLPILKGYGLKVSTMKHAHHRFDVDKPGKDSFRHREAGASEVLITSDQRWVLMHELRGEPEPSLHEQLVRFSPCDLVLVEGYKHAAIPKLEVHRPGLGKPLLHPDDPNIVAVATDAAIETRLPLLDLNRPDEIADFIIDHLDRVHEARIAAVR